MKPRRGATDLAGVLLIDKPSGMTSHDVVATVRRATGEGRVGHAGTLDPLASGLLLVLVGRATRLEQYLVGHDKSYDVRIVFGTATDTLDSDGKVTDSQPVPSDVLDPDHARAVLVSFLGTQQQAPPVYSAIKTGGIAAHRRARAGEVPDLPARTVTVTEARLVGIDAATRSWDVALRVSKGTYVRALARDIGRAAGTVAHVAALRRTAVGLSGVDEALDLEDVLDSARRGTLPSRFIDPVPLLGLPVDELPAGYRIDGGLTTLSGSAGDERVALVTPTGLAGILVSKSGQPRLETAFVPEIAR